MTRKSNKKKTNAKNMMHILPLSSNAAQLAVMPRGGGRKRKKRNRGSNKQKGLFQDIGNFIVPGIGGAVGGIADGLVGSFLGGRSAPANIANRTAANQVNWTRERGSEKLGTFTIPADSPEGTIVVQTLISPQTLGERLAEMASLWNRTLFHHVVFKVSSSAPTSATGNYIQCIEPDPTIPYLNGADLPERLKTLTNSLSANAWAPSAIKLSATNEAYYNFFDLEGSSAAEVRMFAPGKYIIATNTPFPEDVTLTVDIDWDVTFVRPVSPSQTVGDEGGTNYTLALGEARWTRLVAVSNTVTVTNTPECISPAPPANIAFARTAILLTILDGNGDLHPVSVSDIQTDSAGRLVLTSPLVFPADSYYVSSCVPSLITIAPLAQASRKRRLRHVRVGRGYVTPGIKNDNEAWDQRCNFVSRKRKEYEAAEAAIKAVRAERLMAHIRSLSDPMLDELIKPIQKLTINDHSVLGNDGLDAV